MQGLNGKTAVVTGAASGIGLAACKVLLSYGVNVVMTDINEPALNDVAQTLQGNVSTLRHDVSRQED